MAEKKLAKIPKELEGQATLEEDIARVEEVSSKDELNKMLSHGWKFINALERGEQIIYVIGLPRKEKHVKPLQPVFGVVALALGILLIWNIVYGREQGWVVANFTEFEALLIFAGILLTTLGLSQVIAAVPAIAEHMH